ncbi:MAG: DNRLRE domain-containing protein, partial [Nanoarchaeota archaeon]|nr:DNRLRE domain-containing protein [Nanoarchaeota archaeon]
TTVVGIFILLSLTYHFQISDLTGNISCEGSYLNPCISEFEVKNPNSFYVDIYSKDQVKLDFSPRIRDWALFVTDGRCSATGQCACILRNGQKLGFNGWRCVDFTNKTKPRADKEYNFRFDRYSTTKFRLVGIKDHPEDNIKWGFGVNNETLDPIWMPFNRTRTSNIEYTRTSEKSCNGSLCTLILYSGVQYVFEDQQWKKLDQARSLKNKGFYINYLEKDPELNLEIIDFNYTSIQVRLNVSDKYNQVPIRVIKNNVEEKKKDLSFSKGENKIETLDFDLDSKLKFGDNSTTIVLQTADTENLEDSWYFATGTVKNGADTDLDVLFGSAANRTSILKYDISSIPSNQDILSANISFFITLNELDGSTEGFNLSAHRVYPSYSWVESTISGSIKPQPGTDFNITTSGKFRVFGGTGEPTGWQEINLTSAIQQDYADGADNSSFIIQGLDKFGSPGDTDLISFASKENSNTTRRPKLTITYQEATVFNPNVTECMSLDIGNKVYLLQNNIQDSVGDCIVINGNNITLDGQGHIINFSLGPDEPFDIIGGIRIKNHNAIIKNVTVTTYDDYLAGNAIGIWVDSYGAGFAVQNVTIKNANVDGGDNLAVLFDIEGKNHKIINSYATNPDQYVLIEYQSSNVLWENITYDVGTGGSFGAVSFYESNDSIIRNLQSNDNLAILHVSEGDNVKNATIINSNFNSGSVSLESGTDYIFINTTYGEETVNGGNLTRKWYFGFQINDSNTNQGIPSVSWALNDTNN